jgi:hypothetical protein
MPKASGLACLAFLSDPGAEDMLHALIVIAHRDIDSGVLDACLMAYLHIKAIDKDAGEDRREGTIAPFEELGLDALQDAGDEVIIKVGVIHVAQMLANVTGGHSTSIERDDLFGDGVAKLSMLGENGRLKSRVSIARSRDLDLPKLRGKLSRKRAVSDVMSVQRVCVQMMGKLALKGDLDKASDKLSKRARMHGLAEGEALLNGLLSDGSKEGFELG